MSSTRHQSSGEFETSNERHLSDPSIAGINVSLRYIGACAPMRTREQTRDAVWLFNYARVMRRTADSLAAELGMSRLEINEALTKPKCECLEKFEAAVARLRKAFLAARPKLAATSVTRRVRRGVREAAEDGVFSIIIGPYRIGKTEPFRDEFFVRHMDRAIFVDTPPGNDMRSFINALGAAMGISIGSTKKNDQLKTQILAVFESGVIELAFFDEAQNLFPILTPRSRRDEIFPEKIQFIRHAWDKGQLFKSAQLGMRKDGDPATPSGGVGFALCATPQFGADLNAALDSAWAAGQFEGRLRRNYCPDTLEDHEIEAVIICVAPEFDDASRRKLLAVTKANAGLLGFMVNVVGKTRFIARCDERQISAKLVQEAAQEMLRGTKIEAEAKAAAAGKPAPIRALEDAA